MLRRSFLLVVALLLPAEVNGQITGTQGFYRFPAVHGSTVVFAAEGDLWTVPITGGLAHRLTSHAAEETDPAISPDGKTLAYTARYEGPPALYTMPVGGGAPTRWTYDGDAAVATSWTPDGKLLYKTYQYTTIPKYGMVQLNLADGTRTPVPLAGASEDRTTRRGERSTSRAPAFTTRSRSTTRAAQRGRSGSTRPAPPRR